MLSDTQVTKMAKVIIKDNVLNPLHGDFNEQLAGLAANAEFRAATKTQEDNNVVYGISDIKLPSSVAQLVVAYGGDVKEWPLWFEISDIDSDVPSNLPNATFSDEEGEEQANTWNTWKGSNHTFMEIDGKFYLGTNANSDSDLDFSLVVPNLSLLKTMSEIKELQLYYTD